MHSWYHHQFAGVQIFFERQPLAAGNLFEQIDLSLDAVTGVPGVGYLVVSNQLSVINFFY
jgi:hypothetical protein